VDGLFSALVTLGVVPIIRAPRGGAAEAVAQGLDTKLRDHLRCAPGRQRGAAACVQRAAAASPLPLE